MNFSKILFVSHPSSEYCHLGKKKPKQRKKNLAQFQIYLSWTILFTFCGGDVHTCTYMYIHTLETHPWWCTCQPRDGQSIPYMHVSAELGTGSGLKGQPPAQMTNVYLVLLWVLPDHRHEYCRWLGVVCKRERLLKVCSDWCLQQLLFLYEAPSLTAVGLSVGSVYILVHAPADHITSHPTIPP